MPTNHLYMALLFTIVFNCFEFNRCKYDHELSTALDQLSLIYLLYLDMIFGN